MAWGNSIAVRSPRATRGAARLYEAGCYCFLRIWLRYVGVVYARTGERRPLYAAASSNSSYARSVTAGRSLLTTISSDGRTSSDAAPAILILTAVRKPYEANSGIGAKARIAKPTIDEIAEATRATPVPSPAARTALSRLPIAGAFQLLAIPHRKVDGEVDADTDRHGSDGGGHQVDRVAEQIHEGVQP